MKKLYEIGDQPLPIKSITKDYDDAILYHFEVPLKAPEGRYEDVLPMKVIFVKRYTRLSDLEHKSKRFLKGDSFILPLIEKCAALWAAVNKDIPDPYESEALQLKAYEVLFRVDDYDSDWHMQNYNDHTIPIKIMATVKYCVTDFIEKHRNDLDIISFLADKEDRGRVLLYDRFSKLIGKSLHFNTMMIERNFFEFICIDPKKLKDISMRLAKIKEILDERPITRDTAIQDVEEVKSFIQDIAEGKVKVSDVDPSQLEFDFDNL